MNDKLKVALGEELKMMRQNKNWSQEELADRVYSTRSNITNYETGRRGIPLDTFFKICDVCNVDAYEILEKVRKYVYK